MRRARSRVQRLLTLSRKRTGDAASTRAVWLAWAGNLMAAAPPRCAVAHAGEGPDSTSRGTMRPAWDGLGEAGVAVSSQKEKGPAAVPAAGQGGAEPSVSFQPRRRNRQVLELKKLRAPDMSLATVTNGGLVVAYSVSAYSVSGCAGKRSCAVANVG